jgi:hypothetical protein
MLGESFRKWGRERMNESESPSHNSVAGGDQTAPSWAVKEDNRARREDHADQSQGHYLVWVLIFAVVPPLVALAWRLAT